MDDEDFLYVAGKAFDIVGQFVFIGMTGETIEARDLSFNLVRFTEDVHWVDAITDHGAERVICAVADE